jgi:hypothetical protein
MPFDSGPGKRVRTKRNTRFGPSERPLTGTANDANAASFRFDDGGATVKPRSGNTMINNSGATSPTVATARVEPQSQTQPSPQQALSANSSIPRTPPSAPLALRTRTSSQTRLPLPQQQTLFQNQLQVQPNQQQSQPQPPPKTGPVSQSSDSVLPVAGPTSSTATPQQAPTSETARQLPQRSNVTNVPRATTTVTPQPRPATASNQQSSLTSQTPGSSAGVAAAKAQVAPQVQAQQPGDMLTLQARTLQTYQSIFTAKRPYPFHNEQGMHSGSGASVLPSSATSPADAKRVKIEDNLAQTSISSSTAPASNTANYKTNTSVPAAVCYLMHTFALPLTFSPACSTVVGCIRTLTMASFTPKQSESSPAEFYPETDGSSSHPKARG